MLLLKPSAFPASALSLAFSLKTLPGHFAVFGELQANCEVTRLWILSLFPTGFVTS